MAPLDHQKTNNVAMICLRGAHFSIFAPLRCIGLSPGATRQVDGALISPRANTEESLTNLKSTDVCCKMQCCAPVLVTKIHVNAILS